MAHIILPMNSFQAEEKLMDIFEKIKEAGGDGVEIRRELLTEADDLDEIGNQLTLLGLQCFYSAPCDLWLEDGCLNEAQLLTVLAEAEALGASLVKVNLGSYRKEACDMAEMKALLNRPFQLTVENNQTEAGGTLPPFTAFFQAAREYSLPVKMTFDLGNWKTCDEDSREAYASLKNEIAYLHLKDVRKRESGWASASLSHESMEFCREMARELTDVPLAPEYPLTDKKELKESIRLLRKAGESHVYY
ncbi:hypothetical protein LRR81_20040 [Metabacillus sp. GX 13764]|uniref:sugar phosphate isomerase/epimerase family protein n=1 Tax=Metabacillus kandeliae TaxID=2900151 RepID=UPI001E46B54F|nr:hypothetical protein [Metabacillus kandeliae]MCD7036543.1 hypothetical protein [Metabacillus kandeliae]